MRPIWRNLVHGSIKYRYVTVHVNGRACGIMLSVPATKVKRFISWASLRQAVSDLGETMLAPHGGKNPVIPAPTVVAFLRLHPKLEIFPGDTLPAVPPHG